MYLKVNGFGIDYTLDGVRTGLPVLLIHGFPFSKEMWKPQIEILKEDYYVLSYDVRGHGASDVGNGQYTIEYCVDDLIGLLDNLKIPQVVAVGLSMGGYIALRAIERNPGRFKGLVLCDTRSEDDSNEVKIKRAVQARNVKIYGMRKFAASFLPTILYDETLKNNSDAVELLRKIMEKTSPDAVAGILIALGGRTNTTRSLSNIKVPTLIMVGQYDELTPPSFSLSMKEKIPNSEMHLISNAAHISNLENAEEFNRYLLRFLEKIDR